jgi:UDP-N-acetyl-D-mannosaminuronic acid dehydrogenase
VKTEELLARIDGREASVGVVGLGYVGLAAAAVIAGAGLRVIGVEIRKDRVERLNAGLSPIAGDEPGLAELLAEVVAAGRLHATTEHAALHECDAVLICVETPVGPDHVASYGALRAACASVGPALKPGALVVVESTLAPGTMDDLVRPALEESVGGREGALFLLAHCPERVMPGKLLKNMRTMDRVLGAYSYGAAAAMRALYGSFVNGRLDDADPLTAELVKASENAYRDVAIAFANELALICERAGGDVWRVRELVNRSPGRNVLLPGSGVGGHCIPKDSWLLASALGVDAGDSLLASARRVNDAMPAHCAELVAGLLSEEGVAPAGARIAVLGYSYLEESDDTRNSPSAALVPLLDRLGCEVAVHDPFVDGYGGDPIETTRGADCAVFMVAHGAYREIDLHALVRAMRHALLLDTRSIFPQSLLEAVPCRYRRLGVTARTPVAKASY